MIKISKTFMIIAAIMLIALFLVSRIAIQNDLNEKDDFLKDYTARKEDLQLTNSNLQAIINDLNKTLQSEINNQNELISQLEDLSDSQVTVNSDGSISAPAAPSTPTSPTPVTRAS